MNLARWNPLRELEDASLASMWDGLRAGLPKPVGQIEAKKTGTSSPATVVEGKE